MGGGNQINGLNNPDSPMGAYPRKKGKVGYD